VNERSQFHNAAGVGIERLGGPIVAPVTRPRCRQISFATAVRVDSAERAAKAIQVRLDRLDEAFLFERSIGIETYDRHTEKLREQLTLARIDRHSGQLEELDVEGTVLMAQSPKLRNCSEAPRCRAIQVTSSVSDHA
jgi:hypothetical protein